MIDGFSRTALLTFPDYEDYSERSASYKNKVRRAVDNIITYFTLCNIHLYALTTDSTAQEVVRKGVDWYNTLSPGDTFFAKQNCEVPPSIFDGAITDEAILQKANNRFPNVRGASVEARFELLLKRSSLASREIVRQQKLLIYFKHKGMKPTHKAGSNKLHIEIDSVNFIPTCYMGDMSINPIDILGFETAQKPVYEWQINSTM